MKIHTLAHPLRLDADLLTKAKQLRDSSLFNHPYVGLADKQQLFLTIAGYKPVSQVSSGRWVTLTNGEHRSVPDDPAAVGRFLAQLGLAYHLSGDEFATDAAVSLDQHLLDRFVRATTAYEVGLLLGYPRTAVMAFPDRSLTVEAQEALELATGLADYSPPIRFSKRHWRREVEAIRPWAKLLRAYRLIEAEDDSHSGAGRSA